MGFVLDIYKQLGDTKYPLTFRSETVRWIHKVPTIFEAQKM